MKARPVKSIPGVIGLLCAAVVALSLSPAARAVLIQGEIHLEGRFQLNPTFDFNNPQASPFGTFLGTGPSSPYPMVTSATGIFQRYVRKGDVLTMTPPSMLMPPLVSNFGRPAQPGMSWEIRSFTIETIWVVITGADFVGRLCSGTFELSGHGLNPPQNGQGASAFWSFTAPPYDISVSPPDVTGPLELTIKVDYDDGRVPVPGRRLTAVLLVVLLATLFAIMFVGAVALRRKFANAP